MKRNVTKATAVSGSAAAVASYAAYLLQSKFGVPAEVSSVVLGGLFAVIGRWAGKLEPK